MPTCYQHIYHLPGPGIEHTNQRLMRKFLFFGLLLLSFSYTVAAQDMSGQWKGSFQDKSTQYMGWGGDKCDYVLDLECKGKSISGFSYTYFSEAGKRYFTICRLEGTLDSKKKYVEIKEVERTKTNVPAEVNNCFQVHKLTFFKKTDGEESLEGSWIPAPNQKGNCGHGLTTLSRRLLKNSIPGFKTPIAKTTSTPIKISPSKTLAPVATVKAPVKKPASPNISTPPATAKTEPLKTGPNKQQEEILIPKSSAVSGLLFEKRNTNILKVIEVESESVKIDLYDSGEVDGDSVSLFLNGKLLMTGKKLSTRPLSIRLTREEMEDENELVMYAENLGSIPPNTALMVVTDGPKRYEVRITSDLQKSGTIRFVRKK